MQKCQEAYHPEYILMLGVLFADSFAQFATWHCKAILAAWYLSALMCVAAAGGVLAPYNSVKT